LLDTNQSVLQFQAENYLLTFRFIVFSNSIEKKQPQVLYVYSYA